jgi:hypothetical protein
MIVGGSEKYCLADKIDEKSLDLEGLCFRRHSFLNKCYTVEALYCTYRHKLIFSSNPITHRIIL